jgi:hypothetical protein
MQGLGKLFLKGVAPKANAFDPEGKRDLRDKKLYRLKIVLVK